MNNCCGSLALYWQNVVLRAVRGAGKDNPLAEIVAFTRLWRAFPRTSLQMSCCFLFPDCEVGFFLVKSEAIQLQGMGEKIGAHPKPSEQQLLWTPVPHPSVRWIKQLHLSCRSFAIRAGEGSQCLLLLQSQPGRAREAPPGSCLPCISSLVSYSSCHHQKPFIRGRCL